MVDGVLKV